MSFEATFGIKPFYEALFYAFLLLWNRYVDWFPLLVFFAQIFHIICNADTAFTQQLFNCIYFNILVFALKILRRIGFFCKISQERSKDHPRDHYSKSAKLNFFTFFFTRIFSRPQFSSLKKQLKRFLWPNATYYFT